MANFTLQNLSFTYPGAAAPALADIDLQISQGEYVLLCGRSGCGKTTLLRHLKTVLTPHGARSGSVLLDGTPLEQISLREQAAEIGFVMQNPDEQIVTDKVWHELAFGLENLGCEQSVMRLRVAEMASFFGIQDWFHREVAELSGGQKQLLNLAAIMAMQPEILILDEPTSQLDPIAAADFLNTLKKINRELGTTILITEHRTEDVFPAADRVVVMESGRIVADAPPRDAARQLHQGGSQMFSALPAPVRIFYGTNAQGSCPLTVREGRSWLSRQFPQPPRAAALPPEAVIPAGKTPALEIREGWFRYQRTGPDVLKGLNFSVPQGVLYAIVGGNGTGKSTMLKSLCGICKLYRGKIKLFGKAPQDYKGALFQGCLSMLPQDPKCIFVKQTVLEDLMEMNAAPARIAEVADICQISHLLQQHPADLSGGETQRAALAKVLLTSPRLLLLDEPTKGLDSFFKHAFAKILKGLCQRGMTVVMVSHDVEFCAEYADLVGMFFDGQVLASNTPRRFFGSNSFYTTAANRMSRCVFQNAVTAADVVALLARNQEAT